MPSLSMVFDVLAIDRASAVFDRVGASAGTAGAQVEAATTTTSNAGRKMEQGLAVAAAAAAAYSVKLAADFQQNMTRLVTTAGETAGPNGIGLVSKGILDMAGQVGIGANELAKGMYTVESAGIHGADALNVLKAAAQGAVQEQADLAKTTDALTTILHDYNIPAAQSADVMSKLVTAVSTGKTTLEDFTGALHSVTPLAAALHVPLADILGDLAAMTASGESAEQATQNMADALRHLQSPTAGMTAELAQLGITSQDLSRDLSDKGLAGTMQEIEQAILQHIDPATQRVLLPAFNQSRVAAQDLATMIGSMPPALAKLSQGLLDGSVAVGDARKQVQGMGGQAGATGLQFLSLYKNADGFNQILKAGGPEAQAFSAALQRAVGDSAGLTVALQLSGEHAATLNENIAKISGSSREAGGNIKGWSEVQGNFNQQLHEAGAALESMAIQFGTKLLPYLTDGLHFITTTAIPGIEHMGAAVGDAAHWFTQLPQPIKDAALALGALKLAEMTGLLGAFTGAVRGVSTAVSTMGMQMGTAFSVAKASQLETLTQGARVFAVSGLGEVTAKSALAESAIGRFSGNLAGAGAALGAVAEKGKVAGSALAGAFGGPVGLAIAGLGVAIALVTQRFQEGAQDEQGWLAGLKQGGQAAEAARAAMAAQNKELDNNDKGFMGFINRIDGYSYAQRKAAGDTKATTMSFEDWKKSLVGGDLYAEQVREKTDELNEAMGKFGSGSQQATTASHALQTALGNQRIWEDMVADSTKTATQRAQEHALSLLAESSTSLSSKAAFDQFLVTLDQYRNSTDHSAVAQDQLALSALGTAEAAGRAGEAWAKSNGIQDTATAAGYAQLLSLQKIANAMGDDTPAAVRQQIEALEASVSQGKLTQDQMDAITRAIDGIPKDPHIAVSADTKQAQDTIDTFLEGYNHVEYTGTSIIVNGRVVANAEGNLLPMSSSVATVVQPGTVRLIGDNPVADEAFIPINNSARSLSILGETAARMGFGLQPMANGGINISELFPVQPSDSMLDDAARVAARFSAAALAATAGAGVQQWAGVASEALAAEGEGATWLGLLLQRMNQESGGNPTAVNLWDSNAAAGTPSVGLMQVIGPTYQAHKDPRYDVGPYAYGTSENPMANITAAIRYTEAAYGSLSAWGQAGGYLAGTDFVPRDGYAYLHRGEAIVPAEKNASGGAPYSAAQTPNVDVKVYIGDREITDIVRVEATTVSTQALNAVYNRIQYS